MLQLLYAYINVIKDNYELMVQAMASISRGFVLLQLLIVKIINGLSKIISKILIFSGDSINK